MHPSEYPWTDAQELVQKVVAAFGANVRFIYSFSFSFSFSFFQDQKGVAAFGATFLFFLSFVRVFHCIPGCLCVCECLRVFECLPFLGLLLPPC